MSKEDIIRTWKDEAYRESLSDEERDAMPDNPAGELNEEDLEEVAGGAVGGTHVAATAGCCHTGPLCKLNSAGIDLISLGCCD